MERIFNSAINGKQTKICDYYNFSITNSSYNYNLCKHIYVEIYFQREPSFYRDLKKNNASNNNRIHRVYVKRVPSIY